MNGAAQIKSLTERGADVLFASKYCEEVERLRCFDSEDTRQEIERCIFAHERAQYLARLARGNSLEASTTRRDGAVKHHPNGPSAGGLVYDV